MRTSMIPLLVLAVAGCGETLPSPVAPPEVPTAPAAATAQSAGVASADTGEPRFIPYDTPPRLTNAPHIRERIQELYPQQLKEAGVGGSVNVWLFIGDDGVVERSQVNQSSGTEQLDEAAVTLAREMVFTPASNDGTPVSVWVSIPVTFSTGF